MEKEPLTSAGPTDGLRPEPVRAPWMSALEGLAVSATLLVGAGLLLPLFAPPAREEGVPRSVHLEWQRRRQQAREATEHEAPNSEGVAHDAEGPEN